MEKHEQKNSSMETDGKKIGATKIIFTAQFAVYALHHTWAFFWNGNKQKNGARF